MKTWTLGPYCVTSTNQGQGAPLIDKCFVYEARPGVRRWRGVAILLTPWRRNARDQSLIQRAIVLAREVKPPRGPRIGPEVAA